MDKKLNPRVLNNILTLIIAAIASIFMIAITSIFTNKMFHGMDRDYVESTHLVIDGYAKLGEQMMRSYKATIDAMYENDIFATGTPRQIQKYLSENRRKAPNDFYDFFFFDFSGVAYSMSGELVGIGDREYYRAVKDEHVEFYVSEATESRLSGIPVFMMVKAVYDKNGNIRGGFGGTIRLSALKEQFDTVSVLDDGSISIVDQEGHFVINRNRSLISKAYVPTIEKYRNMSTTEIIVNDCGEGITLDYRGRVCYIYYRTIPTVNWKICITIPMTKKIQEKKYQHYLKIALAFIFTFVLFGLFFGELKLIDFCQRKEFLYNDYDSTTNLWTRDKFEMEVQKIINRRGQNKYILLEADIAGFKFINQKYGEFEANKVLKLMAKKIYEFTKQNNGYCCRGFADHFYLFFKISSVRNAMKFFKTKVISQKSLYSTNKVSFRVKYGIAFLLPEERYKGLTVHGLIGQASVAKNLIKGNKEAVYSIFDSKIDKRIKKERFLEEQSEKALQENEFFVMYQPKIDLHSEKIVGAEALVRWRQPERGVIPPNDFIPLFERNGFVTKLDFYVYEQVFKFLDQRIKDGFPVVPISVNMSRNHNKSEVFMREFMELFHRYSVPAKYIQIEILETSAGDDNTIIDITNSLHKEGFSVAMDDFGSGESSLNMLTKVPIDVLKFDRVFLLSSTNANGEIDCRSAGFIESLVKLSKSLGKETVFEGVETESQRDFLRVIDCDQVQGYLYSKPLSESDFEDFISLNI